MKYTITFDENPKFDDTTFLWKGISEHAKLMEGHPSGRAFAFFIKDEQDEIKGGCSGYIFYGSLYVDLLWVEKLLRGQNFGTQLMKKAEELAIKQGCRFITVNTMNFEAPNFYKKLGYRIEFERKGFEKDSIMYFLRKDLKEILSKD